MDSFLSLVPTEDDMVQLPLCFTQCSEKWQSLLPTASSSGCIGAYMHLPLLLQAWHGKIWNDIVLSDFQRLNIKRPYRDAQNKPAWRDRT